jgi:hypothetical protein
MSDNPRTNRWGRGSATGDGQNRSLSRDRRDRTRQPETGAAQNDDDTTSSTPYVVAPGYISPTSTSNGGGEPTPPSSSNGEYFVTSPPKKAGLTGSISTLFRRAASREPGKRDHHRDHRSSSASRRRGRSGERGVVDSSSQSASSGLPGSPKSLSNDSLVMSSGANSPNESNRPGTPSAGVVSTSPVSASRASNSNTGSVGSGPGPRNQSRGFFAKGRVGSMGGGSVGSGGKGRLFYSSHADDDSEDSFETRESKTPASVHSGRESRATTDRGRDEKSGRGSMADDDGPIKTILRYRGFSTSIQSMFLDESLVCASMGCFGLILSNRTEFLLQMRNDRRNVKWGRSSSRRTLPSRIVAYALLLTLILIAFTFVVWGFGNKGEKARFADGFYDGYTMRDDDAHSKSYNNSNNKNNNAANDDNYKNGDDGKYNDDANWDDDANNGDDGNDDGRRMTERSDLSNSNASVAHSCPHRMNGIFKLRDMNEGVWIPAIDFVKDEWQQYQELRQKEERLRRAQSQKQKGVASYKDDRDIASDLRIAFVFAFLIVLGILGRRRRMRTRYYLVRARAQEDHLYYASSGAGVKRVAFQDTREDQYEGACSHTLCGCYPTDPPKEVNEIDAEVEVSDEGVVQRKKRRHHDDCVSRAFNCLLSCCCGFVCKCWFQCLSICALAQEAREIRLLLPTRYQRLDYITHQPFNEYQKDVNDLRRGWLGKTRKKSGVMPHLNALSRLSRYILAFFLISFLVIVSTLVFNPRAAFSWPDAVVLIATFAQSFLVIYLVHWVFHKSDLSLDAVIKFFAAGFLIAVPSAFVFEGILVNITLSLAWFMYSVGDWIQGDAFVNWVIKNYRILWILGELFNAYLVAATTEELCKYYTFRCVEHPDLIFLTGLDRKTQDERTIEGGLVKYPFGSHQVEKSNKRDDDSASGSKSSRRSGSSRHRGNKEEDFGLDLTSTEEEFYEDEHDVRTHRQRAAAVTTGMISLAVGLACAENFLYVFLLGNSHEKSGIAEEWVVLFFRSIFPVHALAAALQSVNMVRKFVECTDDNNHRVGVGRIVFPAVLMHGSFDAVLLGINVYIETAWDAFLEANEGRYDENSMPYNPLVVNIVAWVSLTGIMVLGVLLYYRENRNQRHRLVLLEEQEKAKDPDSELPYTSPSEISAQQTPSDVALV